jgi:hypothetical protein
VCLERLAGGGTASYKGMAAHPDGSGRAFLCTQDGKIWIASVPAGGSGAPMQVAPFVDLTGRALLLLGFAPHPEFAANGRFFISYACDAIASPACGAGGYAGSSKPSRRYQLVVEELTDKGVDYGMVTYRPRVVKLKIKMCLLYMLMLSSQYIHTIGLLTGDD